MRTRWLIIARTVALLMCGTVTAAHPGHTSVGEGRFDPDRGRLLLAIEVDAMHLEQEVKRDIGRALDLDERAAATAPLRQYAARHLALRINGGDAITPRLVEWAVEGMSGWLYVEFTLPDVSVTAPAVTLRNSLLMTVRDQEALLTVIHADERASVRWSTTTDAWQPLELAALTTWLAAPRTVATVVTLPASRGGQDLVGERWPVTAFDAWFRGAPTEPTEPDETQGDAAPRVTLYRWWTEGCRFCRASLPAIETLRDRYEARGLRTVAVFHPKPPRPVSADTTNRLATSYHYDGPVAYDEDWSILRSFYLSTKRRRATSVTFLVDDRGVIRFVHPGPEFFPSDDPNHATQNADFEAIDAAIRVLLDIEPTSATPTTDS